MTWSKFDLTDRGNDILGWVFEDYQIIELKPQERQEKKERRKL